MRPVKQRENTASRGETPADMAAQVWAGQKQSLPASEDGGG
jgi:hypothetical protein